MRAFERGITGEWTVNWRTMECLGAGLCLFLQTGAIFPLMLADANGALGEPAKAILRLLSLPVYAFAGLIILRNIPQFIIAVRRNLLFPLLIALPFLSVFWSVSPSTTLRRAVGLLFSVLLSYALAIRFTPKQLLLIVFATAGTCVVLSLALLVVSPGLARMPMDGAIRGIFIHKNSLGWYACIMLLSSTVVLIDGTPGLRRTAFVLWITGAVCLVVSGSMTAIIATTSAYFLIGFYSTLQRARGISRIVIILFVIQVSAGLLILLHELLVPFLEALGKDATLTGRVPLWELVDSQIASHLLFGFGYQAFWTEANAEAWGIWSEIQWQAPHAHNGYRDTILSFGLTGTALFALTLFRALRQGAVLHCRDPQSGWLWLNVFTVMILVMNLTESMFLIPNDAIFVLFSTGIIMFSLYAPVDSANHNLPRRNPARSATILPALTCGILLATFIPQPGKATSVWQDTDALDQQQRTIRDATCAEASAGNRSARLKASSGSEILIATSPDRLLFYVSPDGDDSWSGLLPTPKPDRTDGPFASIEKARDAARKKGGQNTIAMGDGDYYLSQPIVFDKRDTGLTITARCNETPVLHGGPLVQGWSSHADGRWTAPLRLPPGGVVGDLFVNGTLQTRARFPNAPVDGDPRKGWLFAARCPDSAPLKGDTNFCFHRGDIPMMVDLTGLAVDIVGGFYPGSQWSSDTLPVVSLDRKNRTVYTEGTKYFYMAEGSRYFLRGAAALLDAPGEWWYDAVASQLDYIPSDPQWAGSSVVAGIMPTFFRLNKADGMLISGLQFRDGAPQGSGKFSTDSRGFGAIRLEHAHRVRLLGNIIENVGVGIHVSESEDILIAGNTIGGVAGNGIYIGTTFGTFRKSNGAQVLANHIYDVGRVYFETAGVWFQAGDHIGIAHNLIENTAQFGIAGGSIWGIEDAVHDAVIENNVIRNANQQTADGGAIKMMGNQDTPLDSSIRDNLITGTGHLMNKADGTFWPPGYENINEWPSPISWAIYTDGKASGMRIEGNTISGNISAIGINGGWNNVVTGNVIANGSGAAFRVDDSTGRNWRPTWVTKPNLFENNIVSVDNSNGLAAYVYAPKLKGYVQFARNRYSGHLNNSSFRIHPQTMSSGESGSLNDLQKAGLDSGSVITDSR